MLRFARATSGNHARLEVPGRSRNASRPPTPALFRRGWIMSFLRRGGNLAPYETRYAPHFSHARMASFLPHFMSDVFFCTD